MAREAVRKVFRLDMEGQYPKSLDDFLGQRFDFVISVCDRAAESCPVLPGDPTKIRWSVEDPAQVEGTEAARRSAFENSAKDLMRRIRVWMSLPAVSSRAGVAGGGHAI